MKATGIVRRIDDLGRVVIPKEIRRTLRIREGDPLEIFVAREGEVILKKYSPINELGHFTSEYAEALYDALHLPVLISDRDEVIAVSGESKKLYLQQSIGRDLEEAITKREHYLEDKPGEIEFVRGRNDTVDSYILQTIIANGDPIGSIVIFANKGEKLSEVEQKVVETAAYFLGKQME